VINTEYSRGMTTSLQCGLRAVPPDAEGVLFTLVDHPAVAPATLDALLRAPRPLLRVPRFQGKRGHPVWFRRELFDEFLALGPAGAARDVVHAHNAETEFLDLDDPGIVADIDDAEAYRRLMGAAV
jgi:molybdenum cofactor cytidylyltransferase